MDETRGYNDSEWPQLEAMKEHMEQLAIPEGIDAAIRSGMRLGQQRKRRRMLTRVASYTACLLLLASIASVRFSPAVAAYIGDIPGLRSLVQLINYDKGLRLALENDFMQPVGLSEEHDGIKLTVDGILADDTRIIVFYTLKNTDGRKRVINLREVKLVNDQDTKTSTSFGSSDFSEDWESKQGMIDFYLLEGSSIPDLLDLELMVGKEFPVAASDPVWRFVIPIDKGKFEGLKETYEINQTVNVEGQLITFEKMTVYPTRIGLEVAYDPTNTKKLFYFDDIRIEDEKGETFGTINNGILASNISEDRLVLYFQSNYFRKPNQLYLRANTIRALDKSKLEVQIDLDSKELLSRPEERLTFVDAGTSQRDGQGVLVFRLNNDDPLDENRQFHLFDSRYKDASGQSFESNQTGSSGDEFQYYIKKADYKGPLTLTIVDYPSRIRGDINLRIK